jgi:hypothetical protein
MHSIRRHPKILVVDPSIPALKTAVKNICDAELRRLSLSLSRSNKFKDKFGESNETEARIDNLVFQLNGHGSETAFDFGNTDKGLLPNEITDIFLHAREHCLGAPAVKRTSWVNLKLKNVLGSWATTLAEKASDYSVAVFSNVRDKFESLNTVRDSNTLHQNSGTFTEEPPEPLRQEAEGTAQPAVETQGSPRRALLTSDACCNLEFMEAVEAELKRLQGTNADSDIGPPEAGLEAGMAAGNGGNSLRLSQFPIYLLPTVCAKSMFMRRASKRGVEHYLPSASNKLINGVPQQLGSEFLGLRDWLESRVTFQESDETPAPTTQLDLFHRGAGKAGPGRFQTFEDVFHARRGLHRKGYWPSYFFCVFPCLNPVLGTPITECDHGSCFRGMHTSPFYPGEQKLSDWFPRPAKAGHEKVVCAGKAALDNMHAETKFRSLLADFEGLCLGKKSQDKSQNKSQEKSHNINKFAGIRRNTTVMGDGDSLRLDRSYGISGVADLVDMALADQASQAQQKRTKRKRKPKVKGFRK